MRKRNWLSGLLVLLLAPPAVHADDANRDYQPLTVLPFAIRAITDPRIATAEDASIGDSELVIGVTINGESRAYPINQLTGPHREIINDELGGVAIAATW